MRHSIKDWFLATRPWSFPASAMPVLATLAYMTWIDHTNVDFLNGVLSIIGIVIFHASGNVLSDYHDYKKKVDTEENCAHMPLVAGSFTPSDYLKLSMTLFVIGCIVGTIIMCRCGWQLIFAGAAGALFTLTYSTFKYNALGDIAIFASYSAIPIMGTTYALCSEYYYPALVLAVPIGLITVAILHSNNTRDIKYDKKAGIHTFAMLIGENTSQKIYAAEVLLPFVLIIISIIAQWLPLYSLLAMLALPLAWQCASTMLKAKKTGMEKVIPLDEATAKLQLVFSILLTISLFIDIYF